MRRFTTVLLACLALGLSAGAAASTAAGSTAAERFRWDIVQLDFGTSPASLAPGGSASALARDGSKITLTGSGTFGGKPRDVTGGGAWQTFDASGNRTGSGSYRVLSLVSYAGAAGTSPYPDEIGLPADARAGLVVLRVAYSDGRDGLLAVSAFLPGSPIPVFDGVIATMGPVDYWRPVGPVPGVRGGRTAIHLLG